MVNDTSQVEDQIYKEKFREYRLDNRKVHPDTKHNIDQECNINTMFRSESEKQIFHDFFDSHCYLQNKCTFTLHDPLPGQSKSIV